MLMHLISFIHYLNFEFISNSYIYRRTQARLLDFGLDDMESVYSSSESKSPWLSYTENVGAALWFVVARAEPGQWRARMIRCCTGVGRNQGHAQATPRGDGQINDEEFDKITVMAASTGSMRKAAGARSAILGLRRTYSELSDEPEDPSEPWLGQRLRPKVAGHEDHAHASDAAVDEVGIIATSVVVLATPHAQMGSGEGITLRTDIGALICGAMVFVGMFMMALLEICTTRGGSSVEILLVYLQIAIHVDALGLGCAGAGELGAMALLGHATWLLAQQSGYSSEFARLLLLAVGSPVEIDGPGTKRSALDAALDWLPEWIRCATRRRHACINDDLEGSDLNLAMRHSTRREDNRSTLINALRDPTRSGRAEAGLHSRGITKEITAYVGTPISGIPVDYLDTPGVGDTDVTPMKVLTMIEQELMTDELGCSDSIDGVIVTTPIPDGRVKLGAQVVQLLVEHGFLGEEKWRNIILVGTKADRATPEELDLFRTDRRDAAGQVVGGHGTFVMTSRDNYGELRKAIAALPNMSLGNRQGKVKYATPDPSLMAEKFSEKLGLSKEFEAKIAEQMEEKSQQYQFFEGFTLAQERSHHEHALLAETKDSHEGLLVEMRLAGPAERAKLEAERDILERQLQQEKANLRIALQQSRPRNYAFAPNTRRAMAFSTGCKCLECGEELLYKKRLASVCIVLLRY
ncbi:hypothetical protein AK812_SmicGene13710 [Symbiodinium microadriaticum]|uniref:Uncharacterized protein n=1 Tax=Symbiodinium microadriaticum TaxID=2951 RepID=A0A1Q9E7G8_SYMMI|nr:hypothetical protein AK812_SmicGene13710 [Symbiodinium microadriaticum]